MTYDSQVSTTWDQARTDLRDGLEALPNWTMLVDDLADNDYYVLDPPTGSNHHVLISHGTNPSGEGNSHELGVVHGFDWDPDADQFNGMSWQHAGFDISSGALATDDDVQYWFDRVDDGFVFACRRNMGDGGDYFGWMGYELFDSLFNLSDTFYNRVEQDRKGPRGIVGARGSGGATGGFWNTWGTKLVGTDDEPDLQAGYGILNPDSNWSNYVYVRPMFLTSQTRQQDHNQNQVDAPFAQTRLWLKDRSGSDVNSGDVVQDTDGNDLYEIVEYQGERIAIRMD